MQMYRPEFGASLRMVGIKPEKSPHLFCFITFLQVWKMVSFATLSYSILAIKRKESVYLVFTRVTGSIMEEQIDRAQKPAPREYRDL